MPLATIEQILNEPLVYLSGAGPGANGNTDMRVNGTPETPGLFTWTNTASYPAAVARITGHMRCGNAFTLDKFGDLTALTNGLLLQASSTGANFRTLANFKTNSDIVDQTGDMTAATISGSGTTVPMNLRMPSGVFLVIPPGGTIRVVVQDNLTGLQRLRARIFGSLVGAGYQGSVA